MGKNLVEKIMAEHLVSGEMAPGNEIGIRVDQTLTQDATGTLAYLQFEAMGFDKVRNELAVSYVDHNTVQCASENADDHKYLRTVAAKYGIVYSKPGNGICHELHLERFGIPGRTLLGADSHTPTAGGIGMFAVGAGGIDVAAAMGGQPYYFVCPAVTKVHLMGHLPQWSTAKDVVLKVLETLGTRGNAGKVLEYGGPGVRTLDIAERATITNMGAECGVTTSVFPSDEATKKFLEAQERGEVWQEAAADKDANYENVLKIDLSTIEPLAALPHSPGNVASVASLAGTKVGQVLIGSCTNASYKDLKSVCSLLAGHRVCDDVTLAIAPGSRQVLSMLAKDKSLGVLVAAGARILEPACGFCIGNSMAPASNCISIRTCNRNFEGRSGTMSAKVYLTSPEIAALAALHGRIVDPRLMENLKCPRVRMPAKFEIDDSMFLQPSEKSASAKVSRGPSMGDAPTNDPLPADIDGVVVLKVGDDVTTDHITPAGARLKHRSNIAAYSDFVFEKVDATFAERAGKLRDKGVHNVVVGGKSYGQGSSREHAGACPMYLGVKAVLAKSIERIHAANLVNYGILPLIFEKGSDYDAISQSDAVCVKGIREALTNGEERVTVTYGDSESTIRVRLALSERERRILLAGGLLNMLRQTTE